MNCCDVTGVTTHVDTRNPTNILTTSRSGATNFSGSYYDAMPVPSDHFVSDLETRALLKLKNQQVSLSQAFVERGQVVDLVTSNAKRIAKLVNGIYRGDFGAVLVAAGVRGRGNVKTPHQRFLEMQYGWKPLLSDIHGAVQALSDNDEAHRDRYTATVKASCGVSDDYSRQLPQDSIPGIKYTTVKQSRVSHKGYIRLDYDKTNPILATAASLGLTNPLELAWEELPFSFVADWFVPVGNYLSTIDATYGWTFKSGSRSVKSTLKQRVLPECQIVEPNQYQVLRSGAFLAQGDSRRMSFSRVVYNASPNPAFPSIRNPFSTLHMAEAIALLSTAILGGKLPRRG